MLLIAGNPFPQPQLIVSSGETNVANASIPALW